MEPLRDTYGYGWYMGSVSGATMCYHSGHNSGFNSFNAWVPSASLSMIILTNNDSIDPQMIARTLLKENPELLAHT